MQLSGSIHVFEYYPSLPIKLPQSKSGSAAPTELLLATLPWSRRVGRRVSRLGAYMSADTLGACIYYMAFSWHACSGGAYMLADMLGAHIYYMVFRWHACSGGTYMSADMLGARIYYMAIG